MICSGRHLGRAFCALLALLYACDTAAAAEAAIDLANDPSSAIAKCEVTAEQPCDYAYLRENLPPGKTQWFVIPGGNTKCLDEVRFDLDRVAVRNPARRRPTWHSRARRRSPFYRRQDAPYGFGVFLPPDAAAVPSKLMLWFTGGGACYDYATCVTTPSATLRVYPETRGYFNYGLARNPLRAGGWAAVTVGYCSGDMHVGDAARELVSRNDATATKTVRFNGYNNTMSVMEWVQRQPELNAAAAADGGLQVAGAGCSAGSLGVQLWADYLVKEMGVSKLQPDSYIGMLPKGANDALNIWNGG